MKNLKKVLLALMAISIIACGLGVYASATEASSGTEILEFYESKVFVNENFDAADDSENASLEELFAGASDEFVIGNYKKASVQDGVLTLSNDAVVHSGVVFSGTGAQGVGLNTAFAFTGAQSANNFAVSLHTSSVFGGAANLPLPLFIKNGEGVKIASGSGASYSQSILDSEFYATVANLEANKFYSVQVYCSFEVNGVSGYVLVTDEDGMMVGTSNFSLTGYTPVAITVTSSGAQSSSNTVALDYLEIYEGSFARSLSDFNDALADKLIEIAAEGDYDALVAANKVIVDYGFSAASIEDDAKRTAVEAAIDSITVSLAETYAESFKEIVAAFNTELDYVSRKNALDSAAAYAGSIKNVRDNYADKWAEVDADGTVSAAVAAYDAEYAAVVAMEEQTVNYVAAVDSITVVANASYAALTNAYEIINANEICLTYRANGYDEARINAAAEKGASIIAAYEAYIVRGQNFVEGVYAAYANLVEEIEGATFLAGYNGYVLAKNNYIADSTYIPDANIYASYADVIDAYNACAGYMQGVETVANAFLNAIADYESSNSFNVKISSVELAALYINDLKIDYPGIAEAIEKYEAALLYIENQRILAVDYIKAVLAVVNTTNLADRKAALEYAMTLSGGSDNSVEVEYEGYTVLEANKVLSSISSAIQFAETIVTNYISAVANVGANTSVESRRAAIISALSFKAELSKVADIDNPDPAGVASATATLDAAVAKYNSDITAANDAVKQAAEISSATVCASVVANAPVNKVVAIIKKIYE